MEHLLGWQPEKKKLNSPFIGLIFWHKGWVPAQYPTYLSLVAAIYRFTLTWPHIIQNIKNYQNEIKKNNNYPTVTNKKEPFWSTKDEKVKYCTFPAQQHHTPQTQELLYKEVWDTDGPHTKRWKRSLVRNLLRAASSLSHQDRRRNTNWVKTGSGEMLDSLDGMSGMSFLSHSINKSQTGGGREGGMEQE